MVSSPHLIPKNLKNPYYIVAPPYTRSSAGVRCLHLLGRALKLRGFPAYMVASRTNPLLETELISFDLVQAHFDYGLTPIIVYPETIKNNPLLADVVVRFLLNFPGLLGGPTSFDKNDYVISFAKGLYNQLDENILYMPCADTNIFYPPKNEGQRKGRYFYAGKFKYFHKHDVFPITNTMVEITRDCPGSPTQIELAEIFRNAEVLYCYENTSLSLEARLCGCPVVLVPNDFFQKPIAADEVSSFGISWGTDEKNIQFAKETAHLFYTTYQNLEEKFWHRLDKFISDTQLLAKDKRYSKMLFGSKDSFLSFYKQNDINFYKESTSAIRRIIDSLSELLRGKGLTKVLWLFVKCILQGKIILAKEYLSEGQKLYFDNRLSLYGKSDKADRVK